MGRNKGKRGLTDLEKGGVLALKDISNLSNRQIADLQNIDEKAVRNVHRVASQAEKENRNPMDPLIHKTAHVPDSLGYSTIELHVRSILGPE